MNCPSRPDETEQHPDWNQCPQHLNADATTRADLNGIVNLRASRKHESGSNVPDQDLIEEVRDCRDQAPIAINGGRKPVFSISTSGSGTEEHQTISRMPTTASKPSKFITKARDVLWKYAQFVGPGFLIAVAYIDPGNYATDVQAGAATRYKHLFMILMSNLIAIFLQVLCIKLGTVTGLDLASNCRKHLPKWLNLILYVLAEAAIIATDIAEVIGSAIALDLLFGIPLVAGCAITLVDVLLLLLFYRPDGSMARLRLFEYFVSGLVLGVMVCFCIQLSYIRNTSTGEIFRGYLPSSAIVENDGLYLSCGILGATVMPHSLFLGSGIVQPRLRQFDKENNINDNRLENPQGEDKYRPSVQAIRSCLSYSIFELASSLFTFALFVNSAILIVAGSSLYGATAANNGDLFGVHALLSKDVSKAAGTIFALALLLSGTSAGIVCTMAGQMVSEGMIKWTVKPWLRRLITRSISIIPSIIIAAAVGKEGLNKTLTASQVVLSVILPFVSAPLLWFTCRKSIMSVQEDSHELSGSRTGGERVIMNNGWITTVLAVAIWLVLVVMNVSVIVLTGLGKA